MTLIQRVIIGTVTLIVLVLGLYHSTHNGYGSGSLELTSAMLLMLAVFLPYSTKKTYRGLSVIQRVFIGIVDLLVLTFGIYHLTTPDGMRSGILELTAFTLLTLVLFLPGKLGTESGGTKD